MSEARLLRVVPVTGSFPARLGPLRAGTLVPAPAQQKPKLLDQVRDAIRTRHYSYRTEEAYVGWTRRFILFHGKRHPADMGKAEIEQFLTALAVERQRQRLDAEPGTGRGAISVPGGWGAAIRAGLMTWCAPSDPSGCLSSSPSRRRRRCCVPCAA